MEGGQQGLEIVDDDLHISPVRLTEWRGGESGGKKTSTGLVIYKQMSLAEQLPHSSPRKFRFETDGGSRWRSKAQSVQSRCNRSPKGTPDPVTHQMHMKSPLPTGDSNTPRPGSCSSYSQDDVGLLDAHQVGGKVQYIQSIATKQAFALHHTNEEKKQLYLLRCRNCPSPQRAFAEPETWARIESLKSF